MLLINAHKAMKNTIGYIHETRDLTEQQIDEICQKIKAMLRLDTAAIIKKNRGIYEVTTDDSSIVDFNIDSYDNDKVSLVKYMAIDDNGKRDPAGATFTYDVIKV